MKRIVAAMTLLLAAGVLRAQNVRAYHIDPKRISYAPRNFFIASVTDDRADKSIGVVHDRAGDRKADVEGGLKACFDKYLASVHWPAGKQAVDLHITRVAMNITWDGSARNWVTDANCAFSLFAGGVKLIEFTGRGHSETAGDPGKYVEDFLRNSIENDLKKFDGWWAENQGKVATNPDVKVVVTIATASSAPDRIVYSPSRPLQPADFKGPPPANSGPELAATLSGQGLEYNTTVESGQLVVAVSITPYFDKAKSWYRQGGKNPMLLEHEQLHFDITALKACELADALRKTRMTRDNFADIVVRLQQQNEKDSDNEEDQYDSETRHGTIPARQVEWEQKIRARLKACDCYK